MGLFSKKNNEYKEASKNLNQNQLAADRLVIERLKDDDQRAAELVDLLKSGTPIILNFEDLNEEERSIVEENKKNFSYRTKDESIVNDKRRLESLKKKIEKV